MAACFDTSRLPVILVFEGPDMGLLILPFDEVALAAVCDFVIAQEGFRGAFTAAATAAAVTTNITAREVIWGAVAGITYSTEIGRSVAELLQRFRQVDVKFLASNR